MVLLGCARSLSRVGSVSSKMLVLKPPYKYFWVICAYAADGVSTVFFCTGDWLFLEVSIPCKNWKLNLLYLYTYIKINKLSSWQYSHGVTSRYRLHKRKQADSPVAATAAVVQVIAMGSMYFSVISELGTNTQYLWPLEQIIENIK